MTAAKKAAAKKADEKPQDQDSAPEVEQAPEADEKPQGGSSDKDATYRVVAPLVGVQIGSQVLQFSAGDILPQGVKAEAVEHLRDLGFIEKN